MKNEKLKKKENESKEHYINRIYSSKVENNLTNKEVAEIINNELGTSCQESYFRGIHKNYSIGYNECLENMSNKNEDIKELEEKKLEIEKLKIQYQDQKREYRNYLRMEARFEHLKQEMISEINKLNEYRPLCNEYHNLSIMGDREATLILSDLHIGMQIDDNFNKYNNQIAKERLDYLMNKTIDYCNLHKVETLHIELLGDLANGYLHLGNRVNNEEDVISQTMLVSEMLSNFIKVLSDNIPYINIYSTIGNHGRCSSNLKDSLSIENFERLIPWYMKSRLNCNNVKFIENKYDEIIVYKVINETIFAVHGHRDKMNKSIDNLSKYLKIFPSEIHMGHFHRHSTLEDNDIELIVNGSFAGTDEFAKSIRKSNKPSQTLIIYNNEGQECIYNIKLN